MPANVARVSKSGVEHIVTDESRALVKTLSAVGTRHEDIASKMGISDDTLVRKYRQELDDGRIDANAVIAKSLYEQARGGNTVAMIFWLKTRAKWHETLAVTGVEGGPIQIQAVPWLQEREVAGR